MLCKRFLLRGHKLLQYGVKKADRLMHTIIAIPFTDGVPLRLIWENYILFDANVVQSRQINIE